MQSKWLPRVIGLAALLVLALIEGPRNIYAHQAAPQAPAPAESSAAADQGAGGLSQFLPHGVCLLWDPALLLLHVVSDALIALAYYSIPIALLFFVRKRKDLAFGWIFVLFAIFIIACGTTHILGIVMIWRPAYWLDGMVKALTAAVSVVTGILLWPLIPRALALPSPAQLRSAYNELEEKNRLVEGASAVRKQVAIKIEIDPAVEDVVVDPGKLKQVLYNYLSNALKFTGDNGRIMVGTLSERGNWFLIEAPARFTRSCPASLGPRRKLPAMASLSPRGR